MRFALIALLLVSSAWAVPADDTAMARFLLERGGEHENAGRLDAAANDYAAAVGHARKADRALLSEALRHLGYIRYYRGEMNQALVDLQEAYDVAPDDAHKREALEHIAHVYSDTNVAQYDRAIEYYLQLLPEYERAGPPELVADTLYNLGSCYERKGGTLEQALTFYRRALAAEEKLGREDEVAAVKRSIGVTLGKLGRPAEALPLLNQALTHFLTSGDMGSAMNVRQSRGIVLRRAGRYDEAIADLEATRAWFISQKNTRFLEKTEDELALSYAGAGRWNDAYAARTRHTTAQRELAEKLREEHTSRLRVQFDAEKKEQENRSLIRDAASAARIRKLQTIILVLAGMILAVLALFAWRTFRIAQRMRVMAMTDELTRLPNRRHLFARAEETLHAGSMSVLALDVDHFKRINDTWGHAAGDVVLQRIAHACRAALRPTDVIGRTGGEELTAILPNTTLDHAVEVAERLRVAVAAIDFRDVHPSLGVTVSIGVAESGPGESFARVLAGADEVLYRAKEMGRNRVVPMEVRS